MCYLEVCADVLLWTSLWPVQRDIGQRWPLAYFHIFNIVQVGEAQITFIGGTLA